MNNFVERIDQKKLTSRNSAFTVFSVIADEEKNIITRWNPSNFDERKRLTL